MATNSLSLSPLRDVVHLPSLKSGGLPYGTYQNEAELTVTTYQFCL